MDPAQHRPVHIVGAGGIGIALGAALHRAGVPLVLVETDEEKLRLGQAQGAYLEETSFPASFVPFSGWSPPPGSTVLLCTKTYHNPTVLARIGPEVDLIPVQNGFDPALERFPHRFEGIASFVASCPVGETNARITRPGSLHLGPCKGTARRDDPVLTRLARALRGGAFRVEVVADVRPFKYTKLMYNAAIGPLAAAAGLDNGDLLRLPAVRKLFFALIRENHAILQAAGIPLGQIGPFSPRVVVSLLDRPWLVSLLSWVFARSLRGTYCSMVPDLPRGQTEIEHYNGHLLSLAGNTPCPLNRQVVRLVRRMEKERIPPSLQMLEELHA